MERTEEKTEEKTEEIVNLAETEKKEVANANAEELEIDLDPVEHSDNIQVIKINRSIVCYLLNLCLNITYIPYSYPTY